MDDRETLLKFAEVLKAIFDLQVNEVKATAALAQKLEPQFPGVSAAVQAARSTAPVPESSNLDTLRQQIDGIIHALSQSKKTK